MDTASNRIVPMRLFANWETDRTITNAVQRMFSMSLTRLLFNAFPESQTTLVVTVKLQGSKRSLRSNDFVISANNGKVDVDLDISFAIQYPHFLKRKGNILQILLQRRKRYKNRPIFGYKTLAVGVLNLTEVLQNNAIREILLLDPEFGKDDCQANNAVGRLLVSSCQSQAFETENEVRVQRLKEKDLESEEDDDSSSDVQETDNDQDLPDSNRSVLKQRLKFQKTQQQKMVRRKNLKQKFSSLIKKFKVQEENTPDSVSQVGSVAPTARELEELFEELDNLSDSGPEMAMDNLSIVSNPRPVLRPYFASASREVLPSVEDKCLSEESETDDEGSTDADNLLDGNNIPKGAKNFVNDSTLVKVACMKEPDPDITPPLGVPPSVTTGSICSLNNDAFVTKSNLNTSIRSPSISDWLSSTMQEEEPWNQSEKLWICNNLDLAIPSFIVSAVRVVDCTSYNDCRILISSVVSKIQKFCNSSSASPPCTVIGVIGSEKLVNNVLHAYVESMQSKTADWINLLRFCVVVPPSCSLARALGENKQNLINEIFSRSADDFSPTEMKYCADKFLSDVERPVRKLQIGEAMLQLRSPTTCDEKDTSQLFIPFLSEVKVGQNEEDADSSISSPRLTEERQAYFGVSAVPSPSFPHSSKTSDLRDLQIEYWIASPQMGNLNGSNSSREVTSKRESQLSKSSIRSAFRSFTVHRKHSNNTLQVQFIREKRRDKMFQKLGMKKMQKNESELQTAIQSISNVSRLICSGKHPLEVSIDGCVWNDVRFFQVSAQWQTHVKFFPICTISDEKEDE